MSVRTHDQVSLGEELPGLTLHVDRATLVGYAGASGDRNVIHWDERTAQAVGLPDVIAHGMLTMGTAITGLLDTITVHGRVQNATGFRAGNYEIKTVATCQQ